MPRTDHLDTLITSLTPGRHGLLDRGDAYAVVLGLLDYCRSVDDRATATELWIVLQTIPGCERFGGRGLLHQLLRTAADDGEIRRTPGGILMLRLDAPACGGPEHVWVRLDGRNGAEVEITGAAPWPDQQLHAPGPAWWRCTGCRDNSGIHAADLVQVRAAATDHATTCRAFPAPVHLGSN
jgi:hypothetical protein